LIFPLSAREKNGINRKEKNGCNDQQSRQKSCVYVSEGEGIAYKKVVGTSAQLARVKGIHMRIQRENKGIRSEVSVEKSVGDIYKIRYKMLGE
jgi:hypothetical protein